MFRKSYPCECSKLAIYVESRKIGAQNASNCACESELLSLKKLIPELLLTIIKMYADCCTHFVIDENEVNSALVRTELKQ